MRYFLPSSLPKFALLLGPPQPLLILAQAEEEISLSPSKVNVLGWYHEFPSITNVYFSPSLEYLISMLRIYIHCNPEGC